MSPTLWTPQGREYRPTPADLSPGWTPSPAIERGLWEHDPGIDRIIGAIERPMLLSSGEQVTLVVLVDTGDPDGREWNEWVPVTARIMRFGEERLAREAAPKIPAPARTHDPEMARISAAWAAQYSAEDIDYGGSPWGKDQE